jgi:hypothetical protein
VSKPLNHTEATQCLNLAKMLDLVVSSRSINGVLYVYDAAGHSKPLESFLRDYPLERLQAMVERDRQRHQSPH